MTRVIVPATDVAGSAAAASPARCAMRCGRIITSTGPDRSGGRGDRAGRPNRAVAVRATAVKPIGAADEARDERRCSAARRARPACRPVRACPRSSPRPCRTCVSASTWSCVTKIAVMPRLLLDVADLVAHLVAQLGVEIGRAARRAAGSRGGSPARAPAPRAAAGRRTARAACALPVPVEVHERDRFLHARARSRPSARSASPGRTRRSWRRVICGNSA